MGGYNEAYTESEPQYVPLLGTKGWNIALNELYLDNHKLGVSVKKAAIDTGTSMMVLPTKDFGSFME